MKKLFSIFLLIASFAASSQTVYPPQGTPKGTNRFEGTLVVDSGFVLPLGDTTMGNYYNPSVRKTGMVKYNVSTNYLGVFNGTYWVKLNNGSGGGGSGTLTNITATNGTGQTWTITNPTTTPNIAVALTKAAVGLSNVDNTADANKPVSTAQATAIALKQDQIQSGNTASRPSSPVVGTPYCNTQIPRYEYWDGSAWLPFNAGGSLVQLATPTSNAVAAGNGQVTQSWNDVSNELIYIARISTASNMGGSTAAQLVAGTTSKVWTGLTNGTLYYTDVQAIGDGYPYYSSLRSLVSSGTPHAPPYVKTIYAGNSIVQGTGGFNFPVRAAAYLDTTYSYINTGIGGWNIDSVVNDYTVHVRPQIDTTKINELIYFELANTCTAHGASSTAVWDVDYGKVRTYLLTAKSDGFRDVAAMTATPVSYTPGQNNDPTACIKYINNRFRTELPADSIDIIDLAPTLLGHEGTATWGQDTGYSSYGLAYPPAGASPNGQYMDGLHWSQSGYDIGGRKVADYILYKTQSISMPSRVTYNTVATLSNPSSVTTIAGDGSIDVTVSAVTGAGGYVLQAATNNSFTTGLVNKGVSGTNTGTISGLTNGTPYYVRATAFSILKNNSNPVVASGTTIPVVGGEAVHWKYLSHADTSNPNSIVSTLSSAISFDVRATTTKSFGTTGATIIGTLESTIFSGASDFFGFTNTIGSYALFGTVNYGIYMPGNGQLAYWENGSSVASNIASYASGDTFKLELGQTYIKIYKNGVDIGFVHTISTPTLPLAGFLLASGAGSASHYDNTKIFGANLVTTP